MEPEKTIGKDGLRREIVARYEKCISHYGPWEEEAKEDYRFALGDQWDEEDRQALKNAGRPCLTFNRIRPLINLVTGYERENSSRIKVNPEGGEDRVFSEVCDRALKAVDKWSKLEYKMGYMFDDGCYCGKGFLEAVLSYDKDPVRGELKFVQCKPYQILVDPDCNEYDLNEGAGYVIKVVKLPMSKILELYPNQSTLIKGFRSDIDDPIVNGDGLMKEGENDDYGNRPNDTMAIRETPGDDEFEADKLDPKFTVKEYWRPKMVSRYFVIDAESGEPKRFDDENEAQAFSDEQGGGFAVIKRSVRQMWVAALVAGYVVQDEVSSFEPHYSGYPFFRFMADWAPNAEEEVLRVQGMTRPMKDPQREKNKSKSQNLHILNTQSNSGWVGDDDALSDDGWKKLETMGSKPGIVIKKKKGSDLREIQPKGPNQGHLVREQQANEEFKQISNINPDLMGFQEGTASGRAISMRIKQAILALVRLFKNYQYTKEIVGNFMLEMMPTLFDVRKLKKVLGSDYMAKAADPQKYPQGLGDGDLAAFLKMIADHKYDVYVTEADKNSTIRFEIFSELSDLLKSGAPIPVDLLIDYMDLPNAEEVKQRIKEQQAQALAAAQASPGKTR